MERKLELRSLVSEIRASESSSGRQISGYAAVFDSETVIDGQFTEVIKRGAFARAIAESQDVRCLANHNRDLVLGRTKSGTCRLAEDSTGLKFTCTLADTSVARDTWAMISRGDISGCSFAFSVVKDEWPSRGKRNILDLDLFDVGPVTYPAYSSTSVSARSADHVKVDTFGVYHMRDVSEIVAATDQEIARARLKARIALQRAL